MVKFYKYFFLIFISSFLILYSLQFLADNGLRKSVNSVYHDWLQILEGNINADIIISGSSRAFFGYNPTVLEDQLKMKTFNLGYSAAGYKLQLEKLKIYLTRNQKPKIIIQNIDLTFFNEDRLIPNENEFIPFFKDTLIFNLITNYQTEGYSLKNNTRINNDVYKLDFEKIPTLKAPTEKRFYDGAPITNLEVIKTNQSYKTTDFDGGFPPAYIEELVNKKATHSFDFSVCYLILPSTHRWLTS